LNLASLVLAPAIPGTLGGACRDGGANRRPHTRDLVVANAAFILAYEVGGAIGPALGGAAHERGPKFELVHQILPEFRHLWVAY